MPRTEFVIRAIDTCSGKKFTMRDFPEIPHVEMNTVLQPLKRLGYIEKIGKSDYRSMVDSLTALYQEGKMEGMYSAYHRAVRGTGTARKHKIETVKIKAIPEATVVQVLPPSPLTVLQTQLTQVLQLPDTVTAMIDTVTELLSTDYSDLLNVLESKIEQLESLRSLLSLSKRGESAQKAKVQELLTKLAQLQAQKNRIIPETKILIKEGHPNGQWGQGR